MHRKYTEVERQDFLTSLASRGWVSLVRMPRWLCGQWDGGGVMLLGSPGDSTVAVNLCPVEEQDKAAALRPNHLLTYNPETFVLDIYRV